jgi:H+/Cl- antiporter ClcA
MSAERPSAESPTARAEALRRWSRKADLALGMQAAALGIAGGAVAAVTYGAMILLQGLIWSTLPDSRWVILPVMLAGGAAIGATRLMAAGDTFEEQIAQARDPLALHRRETAWVALGAICAVAFGGAIGPEAGILAVTAQLSSFVALRLSRSAARRRSLAEAGMAGALSGVYGSPAGGPIHARTEDAVPRPLLILAGIAGFASFLLTADLLMDEAIGMMRLPRLTAESTVWDTALAGLAGAAGAAAGAAFLLMRAALSAALARAGTARFWQPVAGGAAAGLLCTVAPILLFSGHNEIGEMLRLGAEHGPALLVLLALGKALACALCVASGWQGGVVFPMCFAGAAAGAAVLFLLPGLDPVLGVAAGMSAAAAVGMKRPLVAGAIMLFTIGGGLAVPVLVGSLIGWYALRLLPENLAQAEAH